MPAKKSPRSPKISRHQTGQADVCLGGHRHYLGWYDESAAHEKGHRLIAEFPANGRRLRVEPQAVKVTELIAGSSYAKRPSLHGAGQSQRVLHF